MKTISSLNDALAYLIDGLYFTEKKLKEEFPSCCCKISSTKVKGSIERYLESTGDKILKLERVFNYLMKEPISRRNQVINLLVEETSKLKDLTSSAQLADILTIGCVQNINAYKIAGYRSAYLFAVELELDTASDLLQQILEWEIDMYKTLSDLAVEEFNRTQRTPTNEISGN